MIIEVQPTTAIPPAGLLDKRSYSKRSNFIPSEYTRKKTRSSKQASQSSHERKSERTLVKKKKDTPAEKVPEFTMTEQRAIEDDDEHNANKSCLSSNQLPPRTIAEEDED